MSRLPDSRPANARVADIRDLGVVLGISFAMTVISIRKSRLQRALWITAGVLAVLWIALFVSQGFAAEALYAPAAIAGLILLMAVVLVGHVVWRLRDQNRLVLLTPDNGAMLDVIFLRRRRLSIANHGRAFQATSAPALRKSAADWVAGLTDYEVDIRAQNKRVAKHYIKQFPMLGIIGKDWMQHPRLGLRANFSRTVDGPEVAHISGVV